MKLSDYFHQCLTRTYVHVENGGDYSISRIGTTLYIYLEASDGIIDWKNNLTFPPRMYKKLNGYTLRVHSGFLKVWKSVEPYLESYINDRTVKKITVIGYSHGAALAVLCHEYIRAARSDLNNGLESYGFGCPRVCWGIHNKKILKIWDGFTVIRNIDDLVTHLPPSALGYFHVGYILKIGKNGKYSKIDAHRPENIEKELEIYEENSRRSIPHSKILTKTSTVHNI